jgi:hypothetical protein
MAQSNDPIAPDEFWASVQRRGDIDCWPWVGRIDHKGYGEYRPYFGGREYSLRAHRVSYELLVGPIPDGLVIDHLCRVRNCVNPAHLEPVTNQENVRRGFAAEQRSTCRNGHPYEPGSYRLRSGRWRICRACEVERKRRFVERHRL